MRTRFRSLLLSSLLLPIGCGSERPTDARRQAERLACRFDVGAVPAETIGREYPIGRDIPIDHFFVLMQENRSFDHYFGTMPGVDGLPPNASNPDANGQPVAAFHTTEYCVEDVEHGWAGTHAEWNGGANDGFVRSNDPGGERSMGYFDATDLPYYHALYRAFAMSERHFCSVLGPTWVNRWYLTSGTSFGRTSNVPIASETFDAYGGAPYSLFQQLEDAAVSFRVYYSDVAFAFGGYTDYAFAHADAFRKIDALASDLAAGDVASVTFVDPAFLDGTNETDEHPPSNPQRGQAFVAQTIAAIMASDAWPRSAIVLTYDEHGGFYDHVPPPPACVPDDRPPMDAATGEPLPGAAFDRYGFRVPLAVISPFAKRGYVSDEVTDHTSILRLVQVRFGLPALTRRDANAWPLLDLFDFEHPDVSIPALPPATIDPAHDAACTAAFP